jgi:hypothetical protein
LFSKHHHEDSLSLFGSRFDMAHRDRHGSSIFSRGPEVFGKRWPPPSSTKFFVLLTGDTSQQNVQT